MAELDDDIDALYGLPLEEFVPERDALAKRLRGAKRRDDADAVKALRKPSVAAWAANQVLRTRPEERDALLAAGDALRAAQERLLAGKGDAAAAREAAEAERRAVGDLVAAARGLARAGGFPSDIVLDRLRETLHAAATDDEVRDEVAEARLSREHRPAAFGGLEGFAAPPPAKPRGTRGRKAATAEGDNAPGERPAAGRKDEDDREAERAREAERKSAERERQRVAKAELKAARAAEREAARERRQAERAVQAAERELGAARDRLERAEEAEGTAAERRGAAEEAV